MKISTLETIHETLKNEHTAAQVNYTNARLELIRCERTRDGVANIKEAKAAEKELTAAKNARDEARAQVNRAEAALRDFEAQEF